MSLIIGIMLSRVAVCKAAEALGGVGKLCDRWLPPQFALFYGYYADPLGTFYGFWIVQSESSYLNYWPLCIGLFVARCSRFSTVVVIIINKDELFEQFFEFGHVRANESD